mgnify:CR=1 FL=1
MDCTKAQLPIPTQQLSFGWQGLKKNKFQVTVNLIALKALYDKSQWNIAMIAEILNYHNQHHVAKETQGVDTAEHSLQKHLDGFLREHQKQAYAIALMSVKQESDAMDVIQETMMAFVQYYQQKPADSYAMYIDVSMWK